MKFKLAVLPGDGVGPELMDEQVKIAEAVGKHFGHSFELQYGLIGGIAIDKEGTALSDDTLQMCRKMDAVTMISVGGPKWDDPAANVRPEDGLLALRKGLGVFANIRPVVTYEEMVDATPLKPSVVRGTDMIVVRELTGGLYFGRPKRQWSSSRGRKAVDSMTYSDHEIERIVRVGFELARKRRKKLTSVDKANVLQSSRLWRQVTNEVAEDYPDVKLEHMLVDTASMRLIQSPTQFDVMVTENTFGDILTDEASVLAGSMGMLPSASLAAIPVDGKRSFGFYEPIHGSAPDIAGQGIVNPIASILSFAMLMRYSLGLPLEADLIEKIVRDIIKEGYRTPDIMSDGMKKVSTKEMGNLIAGRIQETK